MSDFKVYYNRFSNGFRDGVPIGLGYFSVSFAFGMMAVSAGIPIGIVILISATNLTSAGQFAGLTLITAGVPFYEMALTQLVINMRYSLMSISLSQRADRSITLFDRFKLSFFITDEIFAVAMSKGNEVGRQYLYGLACVPYFGWALGTLCGSIASGVLPDLIRSSLGIAIYGMFLAIIIPPVKYKLSIRIVLICAVTFSCIINFLPFFKWISSGFATILCSISAALIGAYFFPIKEDD